MRQNQQREDLHQRITNQIIAAIEAGAGVYQMPWNPKLCSSAAIGIPSNPVGRYGYRGINILSLWASQQEYNYATPEWATFKQWQAAGAQVRKGEKGTLTVFFKATDAGSSSPAENDEQQPRRHFIAKAAYVFNVAQVDGYEPPAAPTLTPIQRHTSADAFIQSSAAIIRHDSHHACYILSKDEIHMPPEGAFFDAQGYYGTVLHELVHWTGHADRCARDLRNRFGTEAYAAEELVAELGAAFLCAQLGITPEPRIDHARYIESWLKVLKNDKRAIFTAAAKANQAADYLTSLSEQTTDNEAPLPSGISAIN
jgi:antirestriction protein ArdC